MYRAAIRVKTNLDSRPAALAGRKNLLVPDAASSELKLFRAWFAEFEAARFDQDIERDAATSRLDRPRRQ
jgi:hypothetical protein